MNFVFVDGDIKFVVYGRLFKSIIELVTRAKTVLSIGVAGYSYQSCLEKEGENE